MDKVTLLAGLGYGDEGKGTIVDWLAREERASLVVRYNGGAQAAHNVVTDRHHHTFAQFGSGTFRGVPTLLSRWMLVSPIALFAEAAHLAAIGISDPLSLLAVEGGALVTTPIHVAANRLREMARTGRHGSCGMGIGETTSDHLDVGDEALFVRDFADPRRAKEKLLSLRDRKRASLAGLVMPESDAVRREREVLEEDWTIDATLAAFARFAKEVRVVGPEHLAAARGHVIFEGAQGVLLDQDFGFQPHTTWTNITFDNARDLLAGYQGEIVRLGVLRAYATRHGAGPFVSEDPAMTALSAHDHNGWGEWQHGFRSGAFDLVTARYALDVIGGVDRLAITNIDRLALLGDAAPVTTAYAGALDPTFFESSRRIRLRRPFDLEHQEALTRALADVRPVNAAFPLEGYAEAIASDLGVPLAITSHGPRAEDKRRCVTSSPESPASRAQPRRQARPGSSRGACPRPSRAP